MRYVLIVFLMCVMPGCIQPAACKDTTVKRTVVLLHGLARSSSSMSKLQKELEDNGFQTCNIDYQSTKHRIEILAQEHILPIIQDCVENFESPVNFVTHSMGGVLVRYIAKYSLIPNMGRVVMLSPPNKGSEVVDKLGETWFFEFINGPAGQEIGTDCASTSLQLGPADFEVGIITGSRSINLILSLMIEGKDDGKVSIERAKLEGMKDFIVLPSTHPFIMKNKTAIEQTIYFLNHGVFLKNISEHTQTDGTP